MPDLEPTQGPTEASLSFGTFRLHPARQLLLDGDRAIAIGGRAFDILAALLDRAGELVTKEELVARVWPGISVDESNLRAQVAALRRALGDGRGGARYVATVPGRGYRFVAPVARSDRAPARSDAGGRPFALPVPLTQPVGRDEVVGAIGERLRRRRFLTIVGTGGIGKTTTALAVARALAPSFENGVCAIDLTPLADARRVPGALASALGLSVVSEDPTPGVIAHLRDRRMLLVFDGCEHFVEAAAVLAEQVLRGAPGAHVLATSREPLRADGESVHRLPALEVPPTSVPITAAEALTYSAVQLFVERASSCIAGFELADADAPVVAEICRRLDGLPLAIELVARRIDAFGVRGVAERLDDRFRLLSQGLSTAAPRQQTLRATLDWSWEHLRERERAILRRLSALSGSFTLETATAVAGEPGFRAADVAELIANLVAKSLVAADSSGATGDYRLLDTTRAYAREKLRESGESDRVLRRLAEYYRDLYARADARFEAASAAEQAAEHRRRLDDVRSALDWAFSATGDEQLGVALTVAALPMGLSLSMVHECRARVERALAALASRASPDRESSRERMQLLAALGADLMHTRGSPAEIRATWARALELAEPRGDVEYQLRALCGLWASDFMDAAFGSALDTARRFRSVADASDDPTDAAVGERMIGGAFYVLGDLAAARRHSEEALARYGGGERRSDVVRFIFDQRVATRSTLAGLIWLQGLPDQATALARANLDDALATHHGLTVCNTLTDAVCPIALLTGDLSAAALYCALLREHAASRSLDAPFEWARCFDAVLLGQRSDPTAVVDELRAAFDRIVFHHRVATSLASLAEALGRAGEVARARAAIDRALARCEESEQGWCIAELLRVKGELLLREASPRSAKLAEVAFQQSLDDARRTGALSWELRSATSLARLWRDAGRRGDARELLGAVYARFSEGFDTSDLVTARRLLDELG